MDRCRGEAYHGGDTARGDPASGRGGKLSGPARCGRQAVFYHDCRMGDVVDRVDRAASL